MYDKSATFVRSCCGLPHHTQAGPRPFKLQMGVQKHVHLQLSVQKGSSSHFYHRSKAPSGKIIGSLKIRQVSC
jgi:hypothetical protein